MLNPISENIDEISSITWDTGWIFPSIKGLPGKVISTFSFFNLLFISSNSKLEFFLSNKIKNSSLRMFKLDAYSFFYLHLNLQYS